VRQSLEVDDYVDLRLEHLTGSGRESSLPEVSSVVTSARCVVSSMGMESTAPRARQRHRNFSISPKKLKKIYISFLGSIPVSVGTVESEGRRMKQC
jgi:hypothetical protein